MKSPTIKSRLINEAKEVIEAMQYFISFIESESEDKIELSVKAYMTETDLIMFKNKFKKR